LIEGEEVSELAEAVKKSLPSEDEESERQQFAYIVDALISADLENRLDEIVDRFATSKRAKT